MAGRPIRIALVTTGGPQVRGELAKTGSAATGMGKSFSLAGKVAKGVFAGIGGWYAASELTHGIKELVSETSKFQSAMTLLQTAGGEVSKNMGTVSSGILNLAGQVGTSVDDLSEGMYTVEKAAYRGAQGLTVLKAAAEGARAENVDMGTMTTALTSIMTSYHAKASDAVKITNEMVAASGEAKTTMQQFAGSLATVLPIASANHISFAQVGGALATLTQHGTSADEATVELANTIRNLAAPNQVAQKEMQQLGLNVTDVSTKIGKRGLTGTLNLLVNTIGKQMGPAGTLLLNAFKQSQSASGDLQVMLKSMPKPLAAISQQFLDGSESAKDYKLDIKGFGAAGYAMGSQFMSLATTASGFNDLLKSGQPAAQTFTDALKKMLGGATGLNTALQLTGENTDKFKERVKEIGDAGKKSGKDISTWAQTENTFAVQVGKVKGTLEGLSIKAGMKLLPWVTDGLKSINTDLVKVEPKLEFFGHVVGDVAKIVGEVPGPIKLMGVESLLLLPILGRAQTAFTGLSTRVTASTGSMRMWTAAVIDGETRSTALGLAGLKLRESMGALSGAGGMLALTAAASQSNRTLSGLERTAGAAMLGFSVAGPWGAAIGGGIGLLSSLTNGFKSLGGAAKTSQAQVNHTAAFAAAKRATDDLTVALRGTIKAYTGVARAAVAKGLKDSNGQDLAWVKGLTGAGVHKNTIIDAALGDTSALKVVHQGFKDIGLQIDGEQAKIARIKTQWDALAASSKDNLTPEILEQIKGYREQTEASKDAIAALRGYRDDAKQYFGDVTSTVAAHTRQIGDLASKLGVTSAEYKKFPKGVRTRFEAVGLPQTSRQVIDLTKKYHLTPRELVTLFRLPNVNVTRQQITDLGKRYKLTPSVIKTLLLVEGLGRAEGNVNHLVGTLRHAGDQAGGLGESVGVHYGDGIVAGLRARLGSVEAASAELVNRALKASNRAAEIRSPSKKTIKLGKYFAQGFGIGIQKDAPKAQKQAERMVFKALDGATVHGLTGLHDLTDKVIGRANKDLQKQVDAAAKQYSRVRSLYLQVKNTVVDSVQITALGANPVGVVSLDQMMSQLRTKVAASETWSKDVHKLIRENLNKTSLNEVLNEGPGSISTVQALLAGGPKDIKQINRLEKQLIASGKGLGNSAAKTMYGVGLQTAKGMLQGLNKDKRQFDKWATDLGNTLTKAVKKALKIKSPSRVFQEIGAYTGQGLVIGLKGQRASVQRSAAGMATSLQKGFGTPALTAYLSGAAGRSAQTDVPTFRLHLTADVIDQITRGKQYQKDIDAAKAAGGRGRATATTGRAA